jgi:hypothetical protein
VAHAEKGDACCKDGKTDACCKDGKCSKGGKCCKDEHGGKGECCDEKCEMEGHAEGHGHMEMADDDHMGMMGMHGRWRAHMRNVQKIAELRYLPGMGGTAGTNSFLVLGGGLQGGGDIFSLAWQHNLAVQLNPSGGAGNWVAPYCGIVPRLGVQLGTARVDVGVLGGFGGMIRTLGSVAPGAQVLDARFQWVVEPRIELGMKNDRMGVALVGSYLLTPNMADMGGVGAGLKFTFKPHGW